MTMAMDCNEELAAMYGLYQKITADAYSDQEKLWAFRQAIRDDVGFPCDGSVIGQAVSVLDVEYDGNERRGLTARCRCADGSLHVVSAADLRFPKGSSLSRYLACYRKWLGLEPFSPEIDAPRGAARDKSAATDSDKDGSIELITLSVKEKAARCRELGSDLQVTFRSSGVSELFPGEIATVKPHKRWRHSGHPYLSGEIESARLDVSALHLVPLKLRERGGWTPEEHYWGEADEPIEEWAKPIIARGARESFEMEQVMPRAESDDSDSDPIGEAVDLKDAGDGGAARKILMNLCAADLRCLDAHAHLGNFDFDHSPEAAIRHYQVGVRIGELSLGPDFEGLLPWGYIDNRPFLRCMHGFGLCLWRLGRIEEAERIFTRLLWLNPSDNQGVRSMIDDVRAGIVWEEE